MTQKTDIEIVSVTPIVKTDGLPHYEISLNVVQTYTRPFSNPALKPLVIVRPYTIHIWQFGDKLWAWRIQNEHGTLFHGSNGGNGEKYEGFYPTFAESMKSFSIHVQI